MAVDEPLLPPESRLTSDIAYVRWHGRGKTMWCNYRYSREELEPWVPKLNEMSQSADVYGQYTGRGEARKND